MHIFLLEALAIEFDLVDGFSDTSPAVSLHGGVNLFSEVLPDESEMSSCRL